MLRIKLIVSLLLCSVLILQAETVSITGTVKKTGANVGLSGVKVQLAKMTSISATTEASGAFTLTGATSVATRAASAASLQFAVKGNVLMFTARSKDATGSIEIFSGNGKRIVARDIKSQNGTNSLITLPNLGSGVSVMRLVVNGEIFISTLMSVDNNFFVCNVGSGISASGKFTIAQLAKNAATAQPVDTLVASKTGFTTKKLPIVSYSQQDVAIELDSSTGGVACTRESLKAITDKYIEAQTAGDPTKMPLAGNVKVSINGKDSTLEKSFLTQAIKIDFNQSIYDVDSCRTFTEIIAANNNPAYVIGTRLKVKDGKVTEISAIITDKNSWGFDAAKYLKYAKQQNWSVLSDSDRISREKLIDAGDQYLDIFNGDDEDIPWGAPCYRIEGGMITLGNDTTKDYCKTSSQEVLKANDGKPFLIGKRDFIVDVDLGTVNVFCAFCQLDSHLFRLVKGRYRYVHTLSVGCN